MKVSIRRGGVGIPKAYVSEKNNTVFIKDGLANWWYFTTDGSIYKSDYSEKHLHDNGMTPVYEGDSITIAF